MLDVSGWDSSASVLHLQIGQKAENMKNWEAEQGKKRKARAAWLHPCEADIEKEKQGLGRTPGDCICERHMEPVPGRKHPNVRKYLPYAL